MNLKDRAHARRLQANGHSDRRDWAGAGLAYESLVYKPEYKETKYFLTHFCQLYYRRNRSTINDDFSQALYFLDGKLRRGHHSAVQTEKHHQRHF